MLVSGFNADDIREGGGILKDGRTLGRVIEGFLETLTGFLLCLGENLIHDLDLGGDEEGLIFFVGVAHTGDIMPMGLDIASRKTKIFY